MFSTLPSGVPGVEAVALQARKKRVVTMERRILSRGMGPLV